MYNITKEEALKMIECMRQIRQKSGEFISFMEHLMQLQENTYLREVSYDPDDYLEHENRDPFYYAAYEFATRQIPDAHKETAAKKIISDEGTAKSSKKEIACKNVSEVKKHGCIGNM